MKNYNFNFYLSLKYILIAVIFLVYSCSSVAPDLTHPPAPKMIPYSGSPFIDSGIRPYPDAEGVGAIIIEWNNSLKLKETSIKKDFGGYYLYRSSEVDSNGVPFKFVKIRTLIAASGEVDSIVIDPEVDIEKTFFYFVKGFSKIDNSNEGPSSDTVNFTLVKKPILQFPKGEVTDSVSTFTFNNISGGEVSIQVYEVDHDEKNIPLDTLWQEKFSIPLSNSIQKIGYNGKRLINGRTYKWRLDKTFGNNPRAASSKWSIFNYK